MATAPVTIPIINPTLQGTMALEEVDDEAK